MSITITRYAVVRANEDDTDPFNRGRFSELRETLEAAIADRERHDAEAKQMIAAFADNPTSEHKRRWCEAAIKWLPHRVVRADIKIAIEPHAARPAETEGRDA